MKTTVTLLILILLLDSAKTKNIQASAPLKPITTLEILENRDLYEPSTRSLKFSIKYAGNEYKQQVWNHQKETVTLSKKGVNNISKPILEARLADH